MTIIYDPACAAYGMTGHPEAPFRVTYTASYLKERHLHWKWIKSSQATKHDLELIYEANYLESLKAQKKDFDSDTLYYPEIFEHALQAAGAAILAMQWAKRGEKIFSLMRPPGHHATKNRAMGFCYLNSIALSAFKALQENEKERIAIWDFDAHHGNGTEAIIKNHPQINYISVHQSPAYPGTGLSSQGNCFNFPVSPFTSEKEHLTLLHDSWKQCLYFEPTLILVSAGFDAYFHDPLTQLSLTEKSFVHLGQWLNQAALPCAAILEGGYSADLPKLIDAFLTSWENEPPVAI